MATFDENIQKIRGDAIYGTEVRQAIADAVEQLVHTDITIDGQIVLELSRISGTDGYRLTFIQGS